MEVAVQESSPTRTKLGRLHRSLSLPHGVPKQADKGPGAADKAPPSPLEEDSGVASGVASGGRDGGGFLRFGGGGGGGDDEDEEESGQGWMDQFH